MEGTFGHSYLPSADPGEGHQVVFVTDRENDKLIESSRPRPYTPRST